MEKMKAIITDLDRTLLRTDKTISDYTLQVLKKCHDKGILVMAATARPERAILDYHNQIHFDAMTVMNGAGVSIPGQVPTGYPIARESVVTILERLCKLPNIILSLECGNEVYASIEIPEWRAIVFNDFPKLPTEGPICKILVSRENENIGPVVETLLTEDTYCTVANNNLVQIMNRDATKWNGIQMMLDACGIAPEQAVYFGDDNDDIESLKNCGIGVAVANAIEAVKEAADVVVENNDEDGVAKWIERNLMINEIYDLFCSSLPYVMREEETVYSILNNKDNTIIEKRNEENKLIGVSVVHKNTILLLCVESGYRRQGIGTWLLNESEKEIRAAGYDEVTVGVGEDYIIPGIPTSKRYAPAVNERLDERVDETASSFFEKRGYVHDWGNECNCFDMKFPLCEFEKDVHSIGDIIDGIGYRFATIEDREGVCACTDAACEDFTRWYQGEFLYTENDSSRVLVAEADSKVVGTLMVDTNHKTGLGSVGCTAVHPDYRGRHIAVNMVTLGTKYLRDAGLQEAYLSYTYSGLDHMYGYAGYKIFVYFMMAKKKLTVSQCK